MALADPGAALDLPHQDTDSLLNRAAAVGLVVLVAGNRHFLPATQLRLAQMAEALAARDGLTAAAFRERAGIGRNLTIDVLEFFDRARFTLRDGDRYCILLPAAAVFGETGDAENRD